MYVYVYVYIYIYIYIYICELPRLQDDFSTGLKRFKAELKEILLITITLTITDYYYVYYRCLQNKHPIRKHTLRLSTPRPPKINVEEVKLRVDRRAK